MNCPNCGSYGCRCTWDEMQRASKILRRRDADKRRETGHPTVIEHWLTAWLDEHKETK